MDHKQTAQKCLRLFSEWRARSRPKKKTSRGIYSPQRGPGDREGISNPSSHLKSTQGFKPGRYRDHLNPKRTIVLPIPPIPPPPPPR